MLISIMHIYYQRQLYIPLPLIDRRNAANKTTITTTETTFHNRNFIVPLYVWLCNLNPNLQNIQTVVIKIRLQITLTINIWRHIHFRITLGFELVDTQTW